MYSSFNVLQTKLTLYKAWYGIKQNTYSNIYIICGY